jgi:hypothetical protein
MMARPGWTSILVQTTRKPKLLTAVALGLGVTPGTSTALELLQQVTKRTKRLQKLAKTRTQRTGQTNLEITTLGPLGKSQKTTRRQCPAALTLVILEPLPKQTT